MAQKILVFADYRCQPGQTELDFAFFLQLHTLGQQDQFAVPNFQKFGTLDAVVADMSPDAAKQTDKDTELKYRVLLKVDKESMNVGNRNASLTPGMSVTAEIKIRQKRIIEFFLDPFRKYTSEALRER